MQQKCHRPPGICT